MSDRTESFNWREVPDVLAERTRELVKAGLGVVDIVEKQGERLVEALRGDRAGMVEDLQERGSEAIDDLQTEANRIFRDLVERGDRLQKAGERRVRDTVKTLSDRPRDLASSLENRMEKTVATTLHRLDIPTRSEVDRLSRRVERLTHEVERLASRLLGDAAAPDILEVAPSAEHWIVRNVGSGEILHEMATKAEAVRAAREAAHAAAPSELRILRQDGSVQDTAHYD